jgi:hypothetical protein
LEREGGWGSNIYDRWGPRVIRGYGVYKSWVGVRRKKRLSNGDKMSLYGCIRVQI